MNTNLNMRAAIHILMVLVFGFAMFQLGRHNPKAELYAGRRIIIVTDPTNPRSKFVYITNETHFSISNLSLSISDEP